MKRAIMRPVITLHGTAVVQVSIGDVAVRDTHLSANFVLNISGVDSRSGTVAFWSGDQIGAGESHREQFHGLTWSLIGMGLMAQKAGEYPRLGKDGAYGVLALWPVVGEAAEAFARVGEKNAVASVELEVGCQAFGIFRSINNPTVFALIEVFDNITSFSQHLETEHFRVFVEYARPQYLGDRSQTVKGTVRWI